MIISEAIELFRQDGSSTGIFYCSKCRVVHRDRDSAWECCNQKYCTSDDAYHCGKLLDTRYGGRCSTCSAAKSKVEMDMRLFKAELAKDYDGWIWSNEITGTNDGFFETVVDLVDYCEENDDDEDNPIDLPAFAFCCNENPPQRVDIGDVLEQMFTDSFEDAQDQAIDEDELEVALNTFWRKNSHIVSYSPDYKRKVAIPATERADTASIEVRTTDSTNEKGNDHAK